MPRKTTTTISAAIVSALSVIAAPVVAAPDWECNQKANGEWDCASGDTGMPVEVTPAGNEPVQLEQLEITTQVSEPPPREEAPAAPAEPEPLETAQQETSASDETLAPVEQEEPMPAESTASTEAGPAMEEKAIPETVEEEAALSEYDSDTPPTDDVDNPTEWQTGETEIAEETDAPDASATPLISRNDEWDSGSRIDRDLNWSQCGPLQDPPLPQTEGTDPGETQISADSADITQDDRIVTFSGNVEANWEDQRLEADRVRIDKESQTLDAEGSIYYQRPGVLVTGETAHVDRANDKGRLEQAEYRLTDQHARGKADVAEVDGRDKVRFEEISYTTCPPGDSAWELHANELEVDRAEGTGTAWGASLDLGGVPVLWVPYASFPIDDRRKSGFLMPSIGHSTETGFDMSLPYYFNIAPDMDATLIPRYMSKRGWLLGGEFRYLTDWYRSEMQAEILPDDKARDKDAGEKTTRGSFSYRGFSNWSSRWHLDSDINYVSDNQYLEDLRDSIAITSARHLERRSDLRYTGDDWEFLGRVQYFQTIDETITTANRPYSRMPQLMLNMEKELLGLTWHLDSEYAYFDHDRAVRGHRGDVAAAVSLPLRSSWGHFIPKAGARHTAYDLDSIPVGTPGSPERTIYTGSLDAGLMFENAGDSFVQTLEPRVYYLYASRENQDNLPVFDTSEFDFRFNNLFRENRFNGTDRVGDADQVTVALTSRTLSSDNGEELFRASIGQIFYFQDREVQLPGVMDVEENSSAVVGEVAARFNRNWSTRASVLWDPHASSDEMQLGALHLNYRGDGGGILNLAHRYRRGLIEQSDLSFRWPITDQLSAVGRWYHSWRENHAIDSFAGLEYSSCCWAIRAIARDFVNEVDGDRNASFMVQFEMRGLTSIGDDVDRFLENGILGY